MNTRVGSVVQTGGNLTEDTPVSNRSLSKTIAAGAAAIALACAAAGPSLAEDARIKSLSFSVSPHLQPPDIEVTSSDGTRWDTIVPKDIRFWADMTIDTRWPGYVEQVGLFLGACENLQCGNGYPLLFHEWPTTRDYSGTKLITASTSVIPTSSATGIAVVPHGDEILRKCNAGLQEDGATKPHSFSHAVTLSFSVNTRTEAGKITPAEVQENPPAYNGGEVTRRDDLPVVVHCRATARTATNPRPDPHRRKVTATGVDLFLATVVQPGDRGPSGTACKPLRVTTRVATDKAGPVTVRLWRKVDAGPITSESKHLVATARPAGGFGEAWVKVETVSKTTTFLFKAEVIGGTFAPSTPWKSITIHCNGDFASPTVDRDPVARPDRRRPTGLVAPPVARPPAPKPQPPRLVCIGGTVKAATCLCPPTYRLAKTSPTTMRCIAIAPTRERPLGPALVGRPLGTGPQPLVRPGIGPAPRPGFAPGRASLGGPRLVR